jgi:hypothetical protein
LIGAPPGYVGYDQGGILTDAINKNPYTVLLLDEIEKAHPDVFNILLQVMDHGKLTDSNGRSTDFRNVILIMTSNAGAKEFEAGSIGLGGNVSRLENSAKRDQALKNIFTPEFRNRLDAVVHFNKLDRENILSIVDKFLMELENQLKKENTFGLFIDLLFKEFSLVFFFLLFLTYFFTLFFLYLSIHPPVEIYYILFIFLYYFVYYFYIILYIILHHLLLLLFVIIHYFIYSFLFIFNFILLSIIFCYYLICFTLLYYFTLFIFILLYLFFILLYFI